MSPLLARETSSSLLRESSLFKMANFNGMSQMRPAHTHKLYAVMNVAPQLIVLPFLCFRLS